jgi:hypothetical protein
LDPLDPVSDPRSPSSGPSDVGDDPNRFDRIPFCSNKLLFGGAT